MTVWIALLRGINIAGRRRVAMTDLRSLVTELGLDAPRTLLQSGNLAFRGEAREAGKLERLLEQAAEERLGLEIDVFVRSAEEWEALVAGNPFPEEARRDPAHLVATLLKDAPSAAAVEALREAIVGPEVIEVRGRTAYVVYSEGIGRSKLTNGLIERKLASRATARNWNTVLKLQALARE